MLHELRWRKPPRDHRRLWVALCIALVLHVFFVAAVWYEMKPAASRPQVVEVRIDQGIQVRFITHRSTLPQTAPPPITLPPPPAHAPVSKNAVPLQKRESSTRVPPPASASSSAAPPPVLIDRTGRVVLPANASSAPAAPTPDYVQRTPQGDTQIMHSRDVIRYKPTALDPYWRKSTNAVDDALQKVVEKTTVQKTIELPGGVRIHCGVSLAALAGGCGGEPPPPPPPTDGDERLNMAPAPLVKGTKISKPDVGTCIADYRASKPLPYGCPVDTPARAVDAQKKPPP